MIQKEKVCYDTADSAINTINFNAPMGGLGTQDLCDQKTRVLLDLGDCITAATSSSKIAAYTNAIITGAVAMVRPLQKDLRTLKAEHNQECSAYYKYQLQ
jgi:hypothetical protein